MCEGACARAPRARVDMWARLAHLLNGNVERRAGSQTFPDLDGALKPRPQLGHSCSPEVKSCGAEWGMGGIRRYEAQLSHLVRIVWAAGGPG